MRVELLIIDPQEDFCNKDHGALFVKGAEGSTKLPDRQQVTRSSKARLTSKCTSSSTSWRFRSSPACYVRRR